MINGDERQRAADELREASTGAYRHVDALDVIAGAVGIETEGKFSHEVEVETYAAIADLIDPTCEIMRPVSPDKFGVCSACGALVDMRCSVANATNYLKPLYCPNCGARVVSGDE